MINTDYPEKTCDIERLVTHPKLVTATLDGSKTEQRRDGIYAYPGETFELEGIPFTVTGLDRKTLGDMTDENAKAEGYPNMETYKAIILRMHQGMKWDEEHLVWVHKFERIN
ncbi:MAG: hypothetical protein COB23_01820 [Methylophaga sp.]|nr:MAG: hypothetical protein COB23_01820 [Methylophaga sp.]